MNKLSSEEKVTTHHAKLEEEAVSLSRRDFLDFWLRVRFVPER